MKQQPKKFLALAIVAGVVGVVGGFLKVREGETIADVVKTAIGGNNHHFKKTLIFRNSERKPLPKVKAIGNNGFEDTPDDKTGVLLVDDVHVGEVMSVIDVDTGQELQKITVQPSASIQEVIINKSAASASQPAAGNLAETVSSK